MSIEAGMALFKSGDFTAAVEQFREVVNDNGNNHAAWNALGICLSKTGKYQEANTCFETAIKLNPASTTYQSNKAGNAKKIVQEPLPQNDELVKDPLNGSGYPLKEPKFSPLGIIEQICPYCEKQLDKFPARKTKCPACGLYIFSKTRPLDRKKVLLKDSEVSLIEAEWEKYHENNKINSLIRTIIPENTEITYNNMERILEKKFGKKPLRFDVLWGINNQNVLKHLKEGNFGFYRNDIYHFANLSELESDTNKALQHYLTLLYLDVNGPNNNAYKEKGKWIYPPFDPSTGIIAPGIILNVCSLIEKNEFKKEYIETQFLKYTETVYKSMDGLIPISPNKAWITVSSEIEKSLKYDGYTD